MLRRNLKYIILIRKLKEKAWVLNIKKKKKKEVHLDKSTMTLINGLN